MQWYGNERKIKTSCCVNRKKLKFPLVNISIGTREQTMRFYKIFSCFLKCKNEEMLRLCVAIKYTNIYDLRSPHLLTINNLVLTNNKQYYCH